MHADSDQGQTLSDVADIRTRARARLESGAVTPSYNADLPRVLKLLNEALATEIVCTLRYRAHYFMADGVLAEAVKKEFLQHALEEQAHADQIAERITQHAEELRSMLDDVRTVLGQSGRKKPADGG